MHIVRRLETNPWFASFDRKKGWDDAVMEEIESVAHDIQECLIAIRVALAAGDGPSLSQAAAELQERAVALRGDALAELAATIRQATRTGEFDRAGWCFGQAVDAFVDLRARLLDQGAGRYDEKQTARTIYSNRIAARR